MLGFCMGCRAHREIQNPENFLTTNGKDAIQGTCPICKKRMIRIGNLVPEEVSKVVRNSSPKIQHARPIGQQVVITNDCDFGNFKLGKGARVSIKDVMTKDGVTFYKIMYGDYSGIPTPGWVSAKDVETF